MESRWDGAALATDFRDERSTPPVFVSVFVVLGRDQAGGAKNSSAMPSGSRKLKAEPYDASLMPP